jgi:hypothetical protein
MTTSQGAGFSLPMMHAIHLDLSLKGTSFAQIRCHQLEAIEIADRARPQERMVLVHDSRRREIHNENANRNLMQIADHISWIGEVGLQGCSLVGFQSIRVRAFEARSIGVAPVSWTGHGFRPTRRLGAVVHS